MFPVPCSRFRVPGSVFPVPCSRFHVPGSVFPVPCSRFRVPGSASSGLRDTGYGLRPPKSLRGAHENANPLYNMTLALERPFTAVHSGQQLARTGQGRSGRARAGQGAQQPVSYSEPIPPPAARQEYSVTTVTPVFVRVRATPYPGRILAAWLCRLLLRPDATKRGRRAGQTTPPARCPPKGPVGLGDPARADLVGATVVAGGTAVRVTCGATPSGRTTRATGSGECCMTIRRAPRRTRTSPSGRTAARPWIDWPGCCGPAGGRRSREIGRTTLRKRCYGNILRLPITCRQAHASCGRRCRPRGFEGFGVAVCSRRKASSGRCGRQQAKRFLSGNSPCQVPGVEYNDSQ